MAELKTIMFKSVSVSIMLGLLFICGCAGSEDVNPTSFNGEIQLPEPAFDSDTSIEHALRDRRSIRDYSDEPLDLTQIGQLLWAAQGITHKYGYRTAPSAGALYPLELYLVVGDVEGLDTGVYHYHPEDHVLTQIVAGDLRAELRSAALDQDPIKEAPAVIVITAIYERTTNKYMSRGERYVHMEVGCAAQNIYLQAVSLDLGTVFIGAFTDSQVSTILQLSDEESPLALMPVGNR